MLSGLELPKGAKDDVKRPEGPSARSLSIHYNKCLNQIGYNKLYGTSLRVKNPISRLF